MPTDIKTVSGREYPAAIIPLIDSAKISLDVIVFDWRWYSHDPGATCQLFNQAVIRAAKRGVIIRVIANNNFIIQTLLANGCQAKKLATARLVHCKLLIIDKEIVATGSHNFTQSAFSKNLELSVILSGEFDKNPFTSFFNSLWQ